MGVFKLDELIKEKDMEMYHIDSDVPGDFIKEYEERLDRISYRIFELWSKGSLTSEEEELCSKLKDILIQDARMRYRVFDQKELADLVDELEEEIYSEGAEKFVPKYQIYYEQVNNLIQARRDEVMGFVTSGNDTDETWNHDVEVVLCDYENGDTKTVSVKANDIFPYSPYDIVYYYKSENRLRHVDSTSEIAAPGDLVMIYKEILKIARDKKTKALQEAGLIEKFRSLAKANDDEEIKEVFKRSFKGNPELISELEQMEETIKNIMGKLREIYSDKKLYELFFLNDNYSEKKHSY